MTDDITHVDFATVYHKSFKYRGYIHIHIMYIQNTKTILGLNFNNRGNVILRSSPRLCIEFLTSQIYPNHLYIYLNALGVK